MVADNQKMNNFMPLIIRNYHCMKNLKLLSLSIGLYVLLGFSSSVNAQHVGQGSFMVGGSLHFESVSFDIVQTDDRSSLL